MKPIDDPIRLLREEHDRVLDVVDGMEVAISDLQGPRRPEALRILREGLQFLEREVRAHSNLEESVLYPALGKHVPDQTIAVMIEEHRDTGWAMDLLAKSLESGRHGELRWHATALLDLLRRHIDKENNVLFMMVSQMLSDREYEDLAQAMHEVLKARTPSV